MEIVNCKVCGDAFMGNSKAKFCSFDCRNIGGHLFGDKGLNDMSEYIDELISKPKKVKPAMLKAIKRRLENENDRERYDKIVELVESRMLEGSKEEIIKPERLRTCAGCAKEFAGMCGTVRSRHLGNTVQYVKYPDAMCERRMRA